MLTWNYFQSEYYYMCWQSLHFNLILFNHKGLSLSLWCDNWKRNQSACIDRFTRLWLRFRSEFDHLRSYTSSSSGYIGIEPDLESFTEWKIRSRFTKLFPFYILCMYILRTKKMYRRTSPACTIYRGGRKSSNDFRIGTGNFTHSYLSFIGSTLHCIISSWIII